jgi:cell division protein FtsN
MEQNKVLLIIVSVALFVAALLSVGLWLFYPRQSAAVSSPVAESGKPSSFDPIEWVRTKEEFPALQTSEDEDKDDVIIVYGEKEAPKPAPSTPPAPTTPVPAAPKPAEPVAQPAPAPRPQPKKPEVKPKPRAVTVREYSIQVGSFSSRDKAEEAGKLLKDKGLAGQILSREVNGAQFYRLRIGPYENKGEAEKFLTWVRGIQGFENSLIFEGYATKTVAN